MAARLLASIVGLIIRSIYFNSRTKIYILYSQTYSFSTILYFWLYLPNAEMTLDLEVNEVEVKVLTSFASVTEITAANQGEGGQKKKKKQRWYGFFWEEESR